MVNRNKKLISKIDGSLKKLMKEHMDFAETGEEIGLKRLIARPIASLNS